LHSLHQSISSIPPEALELYGSDKPDLSVLENEVHGIYSGIAKGHDFALFDTSAVIYGGICVKGWL